MQKKEHTGRSPKFSRERKNPEQSLSFQEQWYINEVKA